MPKKGVVVTDQGRHGVGYEEATIYENPVQLYSSTAEQTNIRKYTFYNGTLVRGNHKTKGRGVWVHTRRKENQKREDTGQGSRRVKFDSSPPRSKAKATEKLTFAQRTLSA